MSNQFREIDRRQPIALPGNLEGWLDGHDLAHFIVEVVEVLDTREIEAAYRGGGGTPYPPQMLLALLFYCDAKGIFTSRKIERATYELIPVVYLPGEPIRITTASIRSAGAFYRNWNRCLWGFCRSPKVSGF